MSRGRSDPPWPSRSSVITRCPRAAGAGFDVRVQAGAGEEAHLTDAAYQEKGATIVPDAAELLRQADVVAKVTAPTLEELDVFHEGAVLIGFLSPLTNPDLVKRLA